ncbi:hypothetical protein cyc_03588 [Cyclospora cayetanensis]|uniref:AP2/ERF domain-containing protein n=1 Tax=Cyclospora cayetanensis TaxID=88456 RepID=A0A1D3CTM5_9EIME|nr:hypothetical protein cyc_03588 [Cyclospora cayetanensis]
MSGSLKGLQAEEHDGPDCRVATGAPMGCTDAARTAGGAVASFDGAPDAAAGKEFPAEGDIQAAASSSPVSLDHGSRLSGSSLPPEQGRPIDASSGGSRRASAAASSALEAEDIALLAKKLEEATGQLEAFTAATELGLRRCNLHAEALKADLADVYIRLAELTRELDDMEDEGAVAVPPAPRTAASDDPTRTEASGGAAAVEAGEKASGGSASAAAEGPPARGEQGGKRAFPQDAPPCPPSEGWAVRGPVLFCHGKEADALDLSAEMYLQSTDVLRHYLLASESERRERELHQQQIREAVLQQQGDRVPGVVFDPQRNCWEARWLEDGVPQAKSFSVLKYGDDLAYKLSVQCRLAHSSEGSGETPDTSGSSSSKDDIVAGCAPEIQAQSRSRVKGGVLARRCAAGGVGSAAASGTSQIKQEGQLAGGGGLSRPNGRGISYRNGILGVSFSRTGNAWLAYIKNRATKSQINRYFRVSVYGWRGAKRKAIEARLELEEEMRRQHQGQWDASPCIPPAVYYDAEADAWVAACQDPVTGQLITKVFRVAEMPGGAAAARSAAIEARLEMDEDDEEQEAHGPRDPEPEEADLPTPPDAAAAELSQPLSGGAEQQVGVFQFVGEASFAGGEYVASGAADDGRSKARKRRRVPAVSEGAPGATQGLKNRRPRGNGSPFDGAEQKRGSASLGEIDPAEFAVAAVETSATAAELVEAGKVPEPTQPPGGEATSATPFHCAAGVVTAAGLAPSGPADAQQQSAALPQVGGLCGTSQDSTLQVQQLSTLLASEQLQQQQKPYCCAQHLEMLQQMDEIQRQLPEVALCRQNMYRRLVALPEQPATPEQVRELESARADFEELSQQQLRMEQQLQLLNQQQYYHALQHRAELLQYPRTTQSSSNNRPSLPSQQAVCRGRPHPAPALAAASPPSMRNSAADG